MKAQPAIGWAFGDSGGEVLDLGEAKRRKISHKELVRTSARCTYCEAAPDTVEHMPPIMLFDNRNRPNGLEFPACKECNGKTKGADAAACFYARISRTDDGEFWRSKAGTDMMFTLRKDAPGVYREAGRNMVRDIWVKETSGIIRKRVAIQASGPSLNSHLNVFSAKLGMALFKEHTDNFLPANGLVQSSWYLNSGLSSTEADAMLRVLPVHGELRQGRIQVRNQFAYRYNTDEKFIVAGLVGLHSNLHVFFIACSKPESFELPSPIMAKGITTSVARPGEIVSMLKN